MTCSVPSTIRSRRRCRREARARSGRTSALRLRRTSLRCPSYLDGDDELAVEVDLGSLLQRRWLDLARLIGERAAVAAVLRASDGEPHHLVLVATRRRDGYEDDLHVRAHRDRR